MALTSFEITIFIGQTGTPRIIFTNTNKSQGTFSSVKFTRTENSLFQSGTLSLFKGVSEPVINDAVVIKLNGVTKFAGYVSSINRSLKGDKLRVLDILGNTKKLFRSVVGNFDNFYQNDWTSNIIAGIISSHCDPPLGTRNIPGSSGTYIDGAYDFQDYIVGDAVKKITQFDNYRLYVDEDDEVQYYIPSAAVKTITEANIVSIGSIEKSDSQLFNDITVIGSGTIKANVQDASSIATYGRFPLVVREAKLDDQADATAFANNWLAKYKDPLWEGSIVIEGDETIDICQKLNLDLDYIDLDEDVEVMQIEHTITSNKGFLTKITFGRTPYNPAEDFQVLRMNISEDLDEIYDAFAAAASAQATADGKIVTFYQDSAPTAEGIGDIWFDTNDDNKAYRWNGSSWVLARDDGIVEAIGDAANAQATADGKVVTFYQASPPTAEGVGDLWVDTDNKEKLYRWSGSAWLEFKEGDVTHDHPEPHNWLDDSPAEAHHPNKVHGTSEGWISEGLCSWRANTSGKDMFVRMSVLGGTTSTTIFRSTLYIRDENDVTVCNDYQVTEDWSGGTGIYSTHSYAFIVPDGYDYRICVTAGAAPINYTYTTKMYLQTIP